VFLKAWDENDHHSVVLREAEQAGMDYFGWKVDSEQTLDDLAVKLEASGLVSDTRWAPEGEQLLTGRRFQFTIPTGHRMEIYVTKKTLGCMTGYDNPDPWPDGLRGMAPSRFDTPCSMVATSTPISPCSATFLASTSPNRWSDRIASS
jgi:catechol 2,3-dioxygenase